jgi:glycosyltransferase involved in cell wall biosynthesis
VSLRIFVNAIHTQTGGGLVYLNSLLPALARRDDVTVAVLMHASATERIAVPHGVEVMTADFPKSMVRALVWEQLNVPRMAAHWRADAVVCPANYVPLFAKNPVPIIFNNLAAARAAKGVYQRVYWTALKALTRASAVAAPFCFTVSTAVAGEYFQGIWSLLRPRIFWTPPGCPPVPNTHTPRADGLLFAVGDYYPHKNYVRLLKAFAGLLLTHPHARLVIVGRPVDAAVSDDMADVISAHALHEAVTLTGALPHEQVMAYFARCQLYVQPSLAESFGMTTVEAMAAGAPCVLADLAFQREVAGESALYVPYMGEDAGIAALTSALRQGLDDATLRERLSHEGRQKAAAFTWDATAQRMVTSLKELTPRA